MFNYHNDENITALDEAIANLLEKMKAMTIDSEEYTTSVDNLNKLFKLKNDAIKLDNESDKIEFDRGIEEGRLENEATKTRYAHAIEDEKLRFDKEKTRSWKPSSDALVGAAASVLGVVLILHYEKLGVITSKAMSFVGKMR